MPDAVTTTSRHDWWLTRCLPGGTLLDAEVRLSHEYLRELLEREPKVGDVWESAHWRVTVVGRRTPHDWLCRRERIGGYLLVRHGVGTTLGLLVGTPIAGDFYTGGGPAPWMGKCVLVDPDKRLAHIKFGSSHGHEIEKVDKDY